MPAVVLSVRTGHRLSVEDIHNPEGKIGIQWIPWAQLDDLENTTYSPAHSISRQGSRYGPLVCPSKPSSGGLQRICS